MKMLIKRLLVVFISLQIVLFPSRVFASVSTAGGWTLGDAVVHGATTTWNATKNVGGKIATGVASIKPTSAQVEIGLKKAGLVGLALIVTQELLDGVDYVLDPANNEVRFKENLKDILLYVNNKNYYFDTAQQACSFYTTFLPRDYSYTSKVDGLICENFYVFAGEKKSFSITLGHPDKSEKTIKLDALSAQIVNAAEAENEDAKAFVSSIAQAQTQQISQALDASQTLTDEDVKSPPTTVPTVDNPATVPDSDVTTGTHTGTNTATDKPTDTPKDQDIPAFCAWAPSLCSWLTWTHEAYDTSVKAVTDYFKEPEEEKEENVDIEEKQTEDPSKFDRDYVQFGGQCPVFNATTIDIAGQSFSLDFDMTPMCDFATEVRPFLIGLAYLGALGIVSSAVRDA